MWTTKRIRREFGGNVCRHCINSMTGVHLYPRDCHYEAKRGICPRCHLENKHIVCGFTFGGKWKLRGR
ncbi:MAG: hypothetical protein II504_03710 [Clostridia bacterium]|nr:hypothetical protein [Clostridia bacterium]